MKITLAVTTYNRPQMTYDSISKVLDDNRIDEILIVDDHSTKDNFDLLVSLFSDHENVSIHYNSENRGCYKNKEHAIFMASNPWVIIWDSDNTIDTNYINRIETLHEAGINDNTIYQPSFARPHFNFSKYNGYVLNKENIRHLAKDEKVCTMLNAMNYFVNRDEYLRVWENRKEPWTADSILQNYNWLKGGNQIYVVPNLEYDHLVHDGSHYKLNVRKTGNLYNEIVGKLKSL